MCLSPHEMTNEQLDNIIEAYSEFAVKARERDDRDDVRYYQSYVDRYTALRAERRTRNVDVEFRGGEAVEVQLEPVSAGEGFNLDDFVDAPRPEPEKKVGWLRRVLGGGR